MIALIACVIAFIVVEVNTVRIHHILGIERHIIADLLALDEAKTGLIPAERGWGAQ